MSYVLDTAGMPARDRVAAVDAAFRLASAPCAVIHEDPDGDVHARVGLWDLGPATLFTTEATGLRLVRTARQARDEAMPVVALSVQQAGYGRREQLGRREVVAPGELMAMDLSAAYDFSWSGRGAAGCLQVPIDHLGLPVDTIRRGIGSLRASPLHRVVTHHVAHLVADADRLGRDPRADVVAGASTELVRALLATAAGDDRHGRGALAESLLARVRAYVRQHLTEPDLGPERIAAAHHVSVRTLYAACAAAGLSLEQWIIGQRLQGARATLADPAARHRSIAAVARAWGFRDPTHFTRRFRDRYGLTPQDWRRQHLRG